LAAQQEAKKQEDFEAFLEHQRKASPPVANNLGSLRETGSTAKMQPRRLGSSRMNNRDSSDGNLSNNASRVQNESGQQQQNSYGNSTLDVHGSSEVNFLKNNTGWEQSGLSQQQRNSHSISVSLGLSQPESSQGLPNKFLNSFKTVLEIMLTTKCRVVHSLSRDLALTLLIPVMKSKLTDNEKSNAMQRESTWWIDALTIDCLPAFCKILNYVSDKPLAVIASVGPALATYDISGTMEFSLFLAAALNSADDSSAFSSYVVQVAARCLMVHRNPMPLVGLIQNVGKEDGSPGICKSQSGQFLVKYTRCLVEFDLKNSSLRFELLGKLLRSCFSSDDEWVLAYRCLGQNSSSAIKDVIGKYESQSFERSLALIRLLIHC
jgi:hypothetical protein